MLLHELKMSSNAVKSSRDRGAPKCSIVLNNVLAVVFRPTSTALPVDEIENTGKPPHEMTGMALFDAFKEANQSTMLTRLNESLDEIRLKGWIFPFTLLIKGPHEDVEVIKEAWRRHFLRSPGSFVIRDIGAVSSVGMEVIQQAPFLPLTKSLVETIGALNENKLTATQESIAEYLAKTYQYVHVPKLNVIHNCLGILIKERKIYHTGNGYFVSATHNPYGKPSEAVKENGAINSAKEPRCVACDVPSKGKKTDNGRKTTKPKGKEGEKKKRNEKIKHLKKKEESSEFKSPGVNVDKRQLEERKEAESKTLANREEKLKSPSETASASSGDGTKNKTKKPKKGMLNQISCFIKGKPFSTAEITEGAKHEQIQTPSTLGQRVQETAAQRCPPLAVPEVESPELVKNERSVHFRNNRTLSAPAGTRFTYETESGKAPVVFRTKRSDPLNYQELTSSLTRSRSFVSSSVKRPEPMMRSNSFTAASARTTARQPGDMAQGSWEAHTRRLNYGDIIRNNPARRTVHVSRPSSFNIGIIRPLDTNQQYPLCRSNSVKKETLRKKAASLSPSSTPRLKEKVAEHRPLSEVRSKSFCEPTSCRTINRHASRRLTIGPVYPDSLTLQRLLKTPATSHVTPPAPKVRITVPPKGKACAPTKQACAPTKQACAPTKQACAPTKHVLQAPKKTPPNSPARKQQKRPTGSPNFPTNREIKQSTIDNCSSPTCFDRSTTNVKANNCKCNLEVINDQTKLTPPHLPSDHHNVVDQRYSALPSNCASSDHIVIEELTSSGSSSEGTLTDDNYAENESKPFGKYKKISDEAVNDSLTFIGII